MKIILLVVESEELYFIYVTELAKSNVSEDALGNDGESRYGIAVVMFSELASHIGFLVGKVFGFGTGSTVVEADGFWVGVIVGETVGLLVGVLEGLLEGAEVGKVDGFQVGNDDGSIVGRLGIFAGDFVEGGKVGTTVGFMEGLTVGRAEGILKGGVIGRRKGISEGFFEKGEHEGLNIGILVGITKGTVKINKSVLR